MIHLDTSFVIDLLREARRGSGGPAHDLLGSRLDTPIAISTLVACELEAGAGCARDPVAERAGLQTLLRGLSQVAPGEGFAQRYGELFAELRRRRETIATMDLLIATAAHEAQAALVTRNVRDFEKVPGLVVVTW
jgi:tRNA(fMet)-specific endonuclease VapC